MFDTLANLIVYQWFGLSADSHAGAALHFFVMDTTKISFLIASPMINEMAMAILFGIWHWRRLDHRAVLHHLFPLARVFRRWRGAGGHLADLGFRADLRAAAGACRTADPSRLGIGPAIRPGWPRMHVLGCKGAETRPPDCAQATAGRTDAGACALHRRVRYRLSAIRCLVMVIVPQLITHADHIKIHA